MATPSLQSLERGLAVLKALNQTPGMGIDSLSALIGLSRGTTYRLLETLRLAGYIERHEVRGKYVVTERVLSLSDGCRTTAMLRDRAQPFLDELSVRYRWPVAIATPEGADMVLRVTTDHKSPFVKRRYTMGSRRPMLFCSSGRVFLANCEASHLSAILSFLETLPINREPLHAANRNELSRMLRSIRRDGFSTYESAEHVTMLSVPIFQEQQILGGLMIRYFSSAMNIGTACERFLSGLQEVAEKIGGASRPAITRNVA